MSRIPFFSKIPLIGRLFKADEDSNEKTELVIYLLPSTEIFDAEKKSEKRKKEFKKHLLDISGCVAEAKK